MIECIKFQDIALTPMLTPLKDQGLLKVEGAQACKFLQGQLTCDVEALPAQGAMGAHCNPKGRIISLFHLIQHDAAFYLLMPRTMVPIAQAALKKYAIFFRTTLTDVSDDFIYFGIQGLPLETLNALADNAFIYFAIDTEKPQPQRHIAIAPTTAAAMVKTNWTTWAQTLSVESTSATDWQACNILTQQPMIYPTTSTEFLPHELNLPARNAVDFNKGCYTGQEIIARLHYRGKIKTSLQQGMITLAQPLLPGTAITTTPDVIAGHIIDSATQTNHQQLLLMLLSNAYLDQPIHIQPIKTRIDS